MENIKRWYQFNFIARNNKLTTTEKSLLVLIFSYVNYETGYCTLSISELMRMTPISDKTTFFKTRTALVTKGFLEMQTIKGIGCKYSVETPGMETKPGMESKPGRGMETKPQKEKKRKEYIYIFEYWNTKKIIVHKNLSEGIEKSIDKALVKYDLETINQGISNYKEILESEFYYDNKFALEKFLTQKNGISEFLDEGEKWENYKTWKAKEEKKNTRVGQDNTKLIRPEGDF